MPNLTDADLRDPMPPIPGAKERAAVAARAHQLGRRRRMMQGAGALGMVAAVAVGVAALTAGGPSSGNGAQRIEAASATTAAGNAAASTTVAAPTVTVPAPQPTPAPDASTGAPTAPSEPPAIVAAPPEPAAPSTFTISGRVSKIPQGATLTLTLSGSGGTFTAVAGPDGTYSISGVPAGTYDGMYEWVDSTGTATNVGKLGGIAVTGNSDVSFSL
jgi:hypothetical protein